MIVYNARTFKYRKICAFFIRPDLIFNINRKKNIASGMTKKSL